MASKLGHRHYSSVSYLSGVCTFPRVLPTESSNRAAISFLDLQSERLVSFSSPHPPFTPIVTLVCQAFLLTLDMSSLDQRCVIPYELWYVLSAFISVMDIPHRLSREGLTVDTLKVHI